MLSIGSSSKEDFQIPVFMLLKKSSADLGEVGLRQLLFVSWLLALHVVSSETGLPRGSEISTFFRGPSVL